MQSGTEADIAGRAALNALGGALYATLVQLAEWLRETPVPEPLDTAQTDALQRLIEVEGALIHAGQPGLRALVRLLRLRLQHIDGYTTAAPSDLADAAKLLARILKAAFDRLLHSDEVRAADLLSCWQSLADLTGMADASPAELLSLQWPPGALALLPALSSTPACDDPLAGAERALLACLRAHDQDEHRRALCAFADVLAWFAVPTKSEDEQAYWRVLHAYVLERAQAAGVLCVRDKKIFSATIRALRQSDRGERMAALEPLVRDALFALSAMSLKTEAAVMIVGLFDLESQLSAPPEHGLCMQSSQGEPVSFFVAVTRLTAELGRDADSVMDPASWLALADDAVLTPSMAVLAGPLRRLAARGGPSDDPAHSEWLAALLLGLQVSTADVDAGAHASTTAGVMVLADLIDRAAQEMTPETWDALFRWMRAGAAYTRWTSLCATMCAELEAAEQTLEAAWQGDDPALALSAADEVLRQIAGALAMTGLPACSADIAALRAQLAGLAALPASSNADRQQVMQSIAQIWVQLSVSMALLPLSGTVPMREVTPADSEARGGEYERDWHEDLDLQRACRRHTDMSQMEIDEATLHEPATPEAAPPDVVRFGATTTEAAISEVSMSEAAVPDESAHEAHISKPCTPELCTPEACTPEARPPDQDTHAAINNDADRSEADRQARLHTIFIDEAEGHLRRLRRWMEGPITLAQSAEAMHVLHTLAGCSATTGHMALASLALALESHLRSAVCPPEHMLLTDTLAALEQMLHDIVTCGECIAQPALLVRLQTGTPVEVPLPSIASPVSSRVTPEGQAASAELQLIFAEEAADLLPQLEWALQSWQQQPDNREPPMQLLRVLHTLKGSARMAGLQTLGDEFHQAETDIAALAQQPASTLEQELAALQERIDRWMQSASGAASVIAVPRESDLPSDAAVSVRSVHAGQENQPAPRLRVAATQLARVVDASAALWVGNACINDVAQDQRHATAALAGDLARLRAQLRELEIESESRILSHASHGPEAGFDPLEFDRYTRLHELTRMMAESIGDLAGVQRVLVRQVERLSSSAAIQARDLRQLQIDLQAMRSQPLRAIESRLRMLLRQVARDTGRDVTLVLSGGDVEIERGLLERLVAPLGHLLRNSVVHGIELPDQRVAQGKPPTGTVTIGAALAGNELRLYLHDDGRGLDMQRVRSQAVAAGLLGPQDVADDTALAALIFAPGLSTAAEVTALSGRGIGMDAVRAELHALGGRIAVDSLSGQGCRFTIALPLELASMPVLLSRAGTRRIALPVALVRQVVQPGAGQIDGNTDSRQIAWQGRQLPLLHLGQALGEPLALQAGDLARLPVVVLQDEERLMALQLDAVLGQREVMVKHPGPQLAQVPGIAGATLLGDGGIALILDPFRMPAVPLAPVTRLQERPLVLVVDDSLTVRRASQRLLERHGYAVALARDGVEALERLGERQPMALLLDIEMPRMDGFELLAALRADADLCMLPVLMITSRIAERHRERAQQLGVLGYLGKPFDEDALLALLAGLRGEVRQAA